MKVYRSHKPSISLICSVDQLYYRADPPKSNSISLICFVDQLYYRAALLKAIPTLLTRVVELTTFNFVPPREMLNIYLWNLQLARDINPVIERNETALEATDLLQ